MQPPRPEEKPHDLTELLALLTQQATEFTGAEHAIIYLYDRDEQLLWNRSGAGADLMEIQFKLGEGIPGHSIETGEVINVEDAARDDRVEPEKYKFLDIVLKTMLVVPILEKNGGKVGVLQLINKRSGAFDDEDVQFIQAIADQAAIGIDNTVLFTNLQEVRRREEALNEEIRLQARKLQDAYMSLDEKSRLIEGASKKIQRNRLIATAFSILLFVTIGYFLWQSGTFTPAEKPRERKEDLPQITEENKDKVPTFTVKSSRLVYPLTLSGTLDAVETQNLYAPFTGRITEVNFKFGESVEQDQLLVALDTEQLEAEYRTARIEEWKNRSNYEEVRDWETGVEMAKARRELQRAEEDLLERQQNMDKQKELFDLGIISLKNWEEVQKAVKQAENGLITNKESFAATKKKGDDQSVKTALFNWQNAALKERDLKEKLDKAKILSPVFGVAIKPTSGASGDRKEVAVEKGVKLDEGVIFMAIADMSRLSVLGKVDELDITSVKQGQKVIITGDAFPGVVLQGTVEYVSSQAKTGGNKPYFEIRVTTFPLTDDQRKAIRLGMTASLSVETYVNPDALLIPFSTIRLEPSGNYVYKLEAGSTEPVKTLISRGITTPKGEVEVLSGIKPGDRLLILQPE